MTQSKANANKLNLLNLKEVSSLIGVSDATVKNWVRSGYLSAFSGNQFDIKEVQRVKKELDFGSSSKLSSRANKRNSTAHFVPDEYISEPKVIQALTLVLDIYASEKLEKDKTLYALSLLLLENAGLVKIKNRFKVDERTISKNLLRVLSGWTTTSTFNLSDKYSSLRTVDLPHNCDFLGLVYQSLTAEGAKAQAGSYYTPKMLVKDIVKDTVSKDDYVLDPCCGTGQFLIATSKKISKPERIWGFDIDLQAVNIAKINLILAFPDKDFTPNIYHKNTLLDLQTDGLFTNLQIPPFDSVISNPPWGCAFHKDRNHTTQKKLPRNKF